MEGSYWTEEKHVSFLNKMEECFVKTVLSSRIFNHGKAEANRVLRLDRVVPDSETESNRSCVSGAGGAAKCINGTAKKRRLLLHCSELQDQVVPESENPRTEVENSHKKYKKGIAHDRL